MNPLPDHTDHVFDWDLPKTWLCIVAEYADDQYPPMSKRPFRGAVPSIIVLWMESNPKADYEL